MKPIQIHQFSPSAHEGDGITNGMFYLQKILHELGFVSYIYAENHDKKLKNSVLHYKKLNKKDKNQLLLIHYSIYYDFKKWIDKLPARKVMIYHNITPYTFFEKGSLLYTMCKKGKEYLPELSNSVEASIGDSRLNSDELKEHNFKNIHTIPLLIDIQKIIDAPWNQSLFDEKVENFNIIFIGRIARNKAQLDLIEIANIYKQMCNDFKMYIIGGTTDLSYYTELKAQISEYNLEEQVILTGKVSNEDLFAYYRSANLFLCMSEHEGFGIPLIESMLFDLPVIAFNSSNIKSTLNGGGILFNHKSYEHIAATIKILRENHPFRRAILEGQRKAREVYVHHTIVHELVEFLKSINIPAQESNSIIEQEYPLYQFEGPFDSSYSLAMLNRYSALAFEKVYPNQVSLYATEGGGDYLADKKFLTKHSDINAMAQTSKKAMPSEVVFRNLYPPRVTGMKGAINILNSYGWEESGFPWQYVNDFNQNLDGITVMSNYVKDVLKNSGVTVPLSVVGLGVEHILEATPKPLPLKTDKKFKFLHISSCFPRKGVDVLLKAYTESFTNEDEVTLIIKTFPNPHNTIADEIKEIQKSPNAPQIILINQDLKDEHIAWLYQNSNCLVAPSRGEGFGLPMAEAMLFNLPVITTAFGGQSDFCTDDTAWLIDYTFEKAETHLNLFNSYWAEPKVEDLKRLLTKQLTLTKEQKEQKTKKAYHLISTKFRWSDYRAKTEAFIKELKDELVFEKERLNLGWVSSYNTKCGIASYSEFLLDNFSDRYNTTIFANYTKEPIDIDKESSVIRCWENRFDDDNNKNLIKNILDKNISTVVINFNFGFFGIDNLKEIIETLSKENIKITIIFHSVSDVTIKGLEASVKDIKSSLKLVNHLLVHTIDDLNFFKNMGFSHMALLPHGVINREIEIEKAEIKTIASYGFLLPHKGILELIEAFATLEREYPYLKLLLVNALYPADSSIAYYNKCKDKIEELKLENKIELITDFLEDEESFKLLDRSNLVILPYHRTQESSSASVRFAISLSKPVLCTPQPIFDDVKDIVHFTKGYSPQEMAQSIAELINNQALLYAKIAQQRAWIEEHDWHHIAMRVENFLRR